jgi:phage terminase large subunit
MFRGAYPPPDAIVRQVDYRDMIPPSCERVMFPDSLRRQMEWDQRRDVGRYAHIWLGEYASMSEAQVFKNWKVGAMEVPPDQRPFYGADWGYAIDPTVAVRCYAFVKDRKIYVDACVSQVGCEIDKTPALFDTLDNGEARRWPMKADSARPETIGYMQKHGYPRIEGARKGPGSLEEGVEFLRSFDIMVHPNCKQVIDELTLYSFETDKLTNEVLPKLKDQHNHTIDALRYAVEGLRRHLDYGNLVWPQFEPKKTGYFGDHPGWGA